MTIAEILERSSLKYDSGLLESRLAQRKYNTVDKLTCSLDAQQLASALERAKGAYNSKAYEQFGNLTFEQQRTASSFPGKCFAEMARKALVNTTDLVREVISIKHNDDYKLCIHACNKCEDHFYGTDIELDHVGIGFYEILVAFLDSHVPNWFIRPDPRTVEPASKKYGYRSQLKSANTTNTVETVGAYWQRVQNECKMRWNHDDLADAFVAFHNSVVKFQALCISCHDRKTDSESSFTSPTRNIRTAKPVCDDTLGKSNKRKLNDVIVEEIIKKEAVLFGNESITNLVTNLRVAIGTFQRALISDALDKVPPELRTVLPMVKTASALLIDIDNCESGGVNISLPPLPTNPYAHRTRRITWEM